VRRENRVIKGALEEETGDTSSVIRSPINGAVEFYSHFVRMEEAMLKH
jgi:hypothetical protein